METAPSPAASSGASDQDQRFLWDFDSSIDGSDVLLEVDGLTGQARCRFKKNDSSSCTACLVAPPSRVRAVTLRLLTASRTHDSGSDAFGMCAPSAMDHVRSRSLADRASNLVDALSVHDDDDVSSAAATNSAPPELLAATRYDGIGVGPLGSLVVHTVAGDLSEAQLPRGFGVGDTVRMSVDMEGTLSVAVSGIEIARYAETPDDWRFAVSAGPLGVWEIVEEAQDAAIETPLDLKAWPQAFVRHGYAEDEAENAHKRTLLAMMSKMMRVSKGRKAQLEAYAEREAQQAQRADLRAFEAYDAQFHELAARASSEDADEEGGMEGRPMGSRQRSRQRSRHVAPDECNGWRAGHPSRQRRGCRDGCDQAGRRFRRLRGRRVC